MEQLASHLPFARGHTLLTREFGPPLPVSYRLVNGLLIVEGDMIINGRVEAAQWMTLLASSESSLKLLGNVVTNTSFLWPDGRVPFAIALDLHPIIRANVFAALDHWRAATKLRFVEKVWSDSDWIEFTSEEGGCGSSVGRVGGRQMIHVDGFCATGRIIHEIGHAVGLFHEQSRADRDKHVRIVWDNIAEDDHDQFTVVGDGDAVGPYDYGSIMHYSATNYAKDPNLPTIIPLVQLPDGVVLGQRSGLSAGDILAVRTLYGLD